MSVRDFIRALSSDRVEGDIIKTLFYSVITSAVVLALAYFFLDVNFLSEQVFFLIFVLASYALILSSVHQIRRYNEFTCMTGMMIGMTVGMMAGFLAGFFVGATNGMFFGGMFGIVVGIMFGTWTGSSCGPMGFMEGIMAGFMGGLMGAMTSVMMFNDYLRLASVIVFIVCAIIILGLQYTVFFEMRNEKPKHKHGQKLVIFLSALLALVTTWLMIFGPRSALFG